MDSGIPGASAPGESIGCAQRGRVNSSGGTKGGLLGGARAQTVRRSSDSIVFTFILPDVEVQIYSQWRQIGKVTGSTGSRRPLCQRSRPDDGLRTPLRGWRCLYGFFVGCAWSRPRCWRCCSADACSDGAAWPRAR
eukprot:COSAG06_NODE_8_length_37897_cov_42.611884_36_plen_136_part_00